MNEKVEIDSAALGMLMLAGRVAMPFFLAKQREEVRAGRARPGMDGAKGLAEAIRLAQLALAGSETDAVINASLVTGRCPHGHPGCCGHHDLEDAPIHESGRCLAGGEPASKGG